MAEIEDPEVVVDPVCHTTKANGAVGHRSSKLSRRIREVLALLWPGFRKGSSHRSRHGKVRRSRMRVRHASPKITFNIGSTWAWSLRIYDDHHLLGVMQAASPLLCLNVVEPYFSRGGKPRDPYKILLCCNSNHKRLKLDSRVFQMLRGASDSTPPIALLDFLGNHFDRDLHGSVDGSCVTVMTNGEDEVVDTRSLLNRVFGLDTPQPSGPRQRHITTD